LALTTLLAVVVPLSVLSTPFLLDWLGPSDDANRAAILVLALVAAGAVSLMVVPHYMLNGIGHSRLNVCCVALSTIVAIGFSLVLIPRWGAVGAAISLLAGYGAACPAVIWLVERRFLRLTATDALGLYAPAFVSAAAVGFGLLSVRSYAFSSSIALGVCLTASAAGLVMLNTAWAFVRAGDPLHAAAVRLCQAILLRRHHLDRD
jgi:O-antigen/teichoic acid export membrane protein